MRAMCSVYCVGLFSIDQRSFARCLMDWWGIRLRNGAGHELLSATQWDVATRFYHRRIVGRDCDYRNADWAAAACRAGG